MGNVTETAITKDGELLSYSDFDYDDYNNMTKSRGPVRVADPDKLARTEVIYKYRLPGDDEDYDRRGNLRQVERWIDKANNRKVITRHNYNSVGQVTETIKNQGQSDARTTQYDYYTEEEADPGNGKIRGMLKETILAPGVEDITTSYEYYPDGGQRKIIDPIDTETEYIYDDSGRLVATCADWDNGNGLAQGSVNTYDDDGLLLYAVAGKFKTWNPGTKQYEIEITDPDIAWSQAEYKYDDAARLIASWDRLDLGIWYDYYDNGATKVVESGEVKIDTAFTINHSKAYSQMKYDYYANGWLKKKEALLDDTPEPDTYATVISKYYPDGSRKEVIGPRYGSNLDQKREAKFYYDYLGRTTSIERLVKEPNGWAVTQRTYNDYGRVERTVTPEIEETFYTYNDAGWRVTITPPAGGVTHYEYNDFGQTTKVTQAYNTIDELHSYTKYDRIGRVKKTCVSNLDSDFDSVWGSAVNKVQYYYNDNSAVWKTTTYDISDGITQVDTENKYDNLGRLKATCTDPSNLSEGSIYTFDALGRTKTVHTGKIDDWTGTPYIITSSGSEYVANSKALKGYDEAGRFIYTILNPDGTGDYADLVTYYKYDELSRQVRVFDAQQYEDSDGSVDTYNVASEPSNNFTHMYYEYDEGGRLREVVEAKNSNNERTRVYTYFNNGGRKSMTYYNSSAQGSGTVNYIYHPSGLLKKADYPGFSDRDITTYEYDLNGRLIKREDGRGASGTIQYTYDGAGRLRFIDRDGNPAVYEVEYTCNFRNQIVDMKENDSIKIHNQYDDYGRLSSVTDKTVISEGKTVAYLHYGSGYRKAMRTPETSSGYDYYYHYDEAMRLDKINDNELVTSGTSYVEYDYNTLGQLIEKRYGANGSKGKAFYYYLDNIGWLIEVENKVGTDAISKFVYHDPDNWNNPDDLFNKIGNRRCMYYKIRINNNQPEPDFNEGYVHYRYDGLYQLKEECRTSSYSSGQLYKIEFTYDNAGNRTTKKVDDTDTTSYTYNDANQLITEDAPDTENDRYYEYDAAGNLRFKRDNPDNPTKTFEWQYNSENRLTTYIPDGGSASTYTYNLLSNRVRRQTPTLDEKYILDGADVIADYNGSDVIQRRYLTPGLDDNAIQLSGSNTYYYFKDGLGSIRNVVEVDASVDVKNYYDYEAFGSFYDTPEFQPVTNRYTYTGREWDSESQTYHNRFRQNFPTIGRFGARDPVKWSNLYSYVGNRPCQLTDPFGWQKHELPFDPKEMERRVKEIEEGILPEPDTTTVEGLKKAFPFGKWPEPTPSLTVTSYGPPEWLLEDYMLKWVANINTIEKMPMHKYLIQRNYQRYFKFWACNDTLKLLDKPDANTIWDFWYLDFVKPNTQEKPNQLPVQDYRFTNWPSLPANKKYCVIIETKSVLWLYDKNPMTKAQGAGILEKIGANVFLETKGNYFQPVNEADWTKVGAWYEVVDYRGCQNPPKITLEVSVEDGETWKLTGP